MGPPATSRLWGKASRTISAMRMVLRVRLTIEEMPTMSGAYDWSSACSRSNVLKVQSNTFVSMPSLRS